MATAALKVILVGDSGVGKSSLAYRFCDGVFYEDHAPTLGVDFKYATLRIPTPPNLLSIGAAVSSGAASTAATTSAAGSSSASAETIVKLQLWDTAGQETFLSITTPFYRGSHGAILCFDLTNRDSFENVAKWLERVRANAGQQSAGGGGEYSSSTTRSSSSSGGGGGSTTGTSQFTLPILLVGTKLDIADEGDSAGTQAQRSGVDGLVATTRDGSPRMSLRRVFSSEAATWAKNNGVTAYMETSARDNLSVGEAFTFLAREMLAKWGTAVVTSSSGGSAAPRAGGGVILTAPRRAASPPTPPPPSDGGAATGGPQKVDKSPCCGTS